MHPRTPLDKAALSTLEVFDDSPMTSPDPIFLRVKDPLNTTPVDGTRLERSLDTTPPASTPQDDIIHTSAVAEDELYVARKAEALNARAQAIISAASALAGSFHSSAPPLARGDHLMRETIRVISGNQ